MDCEGAECRCGSHGGTAEVGGAAFGKLLLRLPAPAKLYDGKLTEETVECELGRERETRQGIQEDSVRDAGCTDTSEHILRRQFCDGAFSCFAVFEHKSAKKVLVLSSSPARACPFAKGTGTR